MASLTVELAQLEEAQLIRRLLDEELAYVFKHALTQEMAAQSLLYKTRRTIHRRVAETYEQLYGENLDKYIALLAEHYWQGEVWDKTAEYALRAGEQAMRGYALREALAQYERALDALHQIQAAPEQIIDATLGWVRPAIKLEPYAELLERLARVEEMARECGDKRRLAEIMHRIANVHFANGYPTRAVPALFENYQLATELGDEQLSIVPSYWLAFFMVDRDLPGALAQFEKVTELARKHKNYEIETYAIVTQALAHARLGHFVQARQEIQQALEILETVHSPMGQADVVMLAGYTFLEMGELKPALEYTQQGAEKAKRANIFECEVASLLGVGYCQLQGNALSDAQHTFDESVRLAESLGSDNLRHQARAGLAVAHFLNRQDNAVPEMESALADSQAFGDGYNAAFLSQMLGEAYTLRDPARAERYFNDALDFYRRNEMRPYLARALQSAAVLYEKEGRGAEAVRARDQAEALMKELGVESMAPLASDEVQVAP